MGSRLPTPVVSVAQLDGLLRDGGERPTLLDVRWELGAGARRDRYDDAHIPGAAFVDLEGELAGAPGPGGRHPLPAAEDFTASMRAAGVDAGRGVVVYDDSRSTSSARAWWLLRYFGHASVAVLDGGLDAWQRAGLPLEEESTATMANRIASIPLGDSAEPNLRARPESGLRAYRDADATRHGDFTARPGAMPILDAAGAAAVAQGGVLLDARAPERFRGHAEPVDPVAGHIPGALNRPTTLNVGKSGRFLSRSALRDAFAGLGIDGSCAVGAYCGSGITAAHELLALELAGYRAALYPGSWSEWITDPSRPVAAESQCVRG